MDPACTSTFGVVTKLSPLKTASETNMLQSISIQRFKNLADITICLDKVNVLVGGNNSGKSSILQAIQFAVSIAQTTNLENIKWVQNRLPTSLSHLQLIYSPLRDVSALAMGGTLQEKTDQAILIQLEEWDTTCTSTVVIRKGRNRNITVSIEGRALGIKLQKIEEPFSIYVPGLAGIPAVEEYKNPGIVRKAAARGDANNVFRNILWLLKQSSDGWQQFLDDFYSFFPGKLISVDFHPDRDDYIRCTIRTLDRDLPIDSAGTGILQAIQILAYVNLYKPKLLILDESDAHLHPNNQRKLARILVELSDKRDIQVILTTHSRHLLDELSGSSKIHWIRDGKRVEEEAFDEVKVLMEIGALDKGDRLRNGDTKCVLLTEDTDAQPIKTLLEASNFKINEVDIWPYKGCTKVDTALVLAAFIREHASATQILLHRDRDYLTQSEAEEFKSRIEAANISCFLTTGTDAESHFLSPDHIHYLYSVISVERVTEIIEEVTVAVREKSIKKFINSRTQAELAAYYRGEKGKPDAGEIAMSAMRSYDQDVSRYRYGKAIVKLLKSRLQQETGGSIDLFRASNYLAVIELRNISSMIWHS
jgi:energy-coupling factor transporter ATP-binding protein EcfA2